MSGRAALRTDHIIHGSGFVTIAETTATTCSTLTSSAALGTTARFVREALLSKELLLRGAERELYATILAGKYLVLKQLNTLPLDDMAQHNTVQERFSWSEVRTDIGLAP